jgi:ribosomal protein L2
MVPPPAIPRRTSPCSRLEAAEGSQTVITAFEGLTIEQHVSCKKAVEKIEELVEK